MAMTNRLPGRIHFIGAAGRGMAPVMAAVAEQGVLVSGSEDADTYGDTMAWLAQRGIQVTQTFSAQNLAPKPDLVVIGRSFERGNPEVEAVLREHVPYTSLAELIGHYVLNGCTNILVAGSKGKSTSTAMLVEILEHAQLSPGYLIGGFPRNGRPPARFGSSLNVIEADDYSTLWWNQHPKFLYYRPSLLVLTNVYPDHTEVHGSHAGSWRNFAALIQQLPSDGLIVIADSKRSAPPSWLLAEAPCEVVQLDTHPNHQPITIPSHFGVAGNRFYWQDTLFRLAVPGKVNAINAISASFAAGRLGVTPQQCAEALDGFTGVAERMDAYSAGPEHWVYCDYFGYLPESLAENIAAIRDAHPDHRLTLVFQLRQIDRLPEAQEALLQALCSCDEVILTPYPRPKVTLVAEMDPAYIEGLIKRVQQHHSMHGIPFISYLPDLHAVVQELSGRSDPSATLFSVHSRYRDQLKPLLQVLGCSA
jgi:UDP-N-acetylmuramate: L-alanyl-gamma-D-glutamyl-meso-diaminopimelate ligase